MNLNRYNAGENNNTAGNLGVNLTHANCDDIPRINVKLIHL